MSVQSWDLDNFLKAPISIQEKKMEEQNTTRNFLALSNSSLKTE